MRLAAKLLDPFGDHPREVARVEPLRIDVAVSLEDAIDDAIVGAHDHDLSVFLGPDPLFDGAKLEAAPVLALIVGTGNDDNKRRTLAVDILEEGIEIRLRELARIKGVVEDAVRPKQ